MRLPAQVAVGRQQTRALVRPRPGVQIQFDTPSSVKGMGYSKLPGGRHSCASGNTEHDRLLARMCADVTRMPPASGSSGIHVPPADMPNPQQERQSGRPRCRTCAAWLCVWTTGLFTACDLFAPRSTDTARSPRRYVRCRTSATPHPTPPPIVVDRGGRHRRAHRRAGHTARPTGLHRGHRPTATVRYRITSRRPIFPLIHMFDPASLSPLLMSKLMGVGGR